MHILRKIKEKVVTGLYPKTKKLCIHPTKIGMVGRRTNRVGIPFTRYSKKVIKRRKEPRFERKKARGGHTGRRQIMDLHFAAFLTPIYSWVGICAEQDRILIIQRSELYIA